MPPRMWNGLDFLSPLHSCALCHSSCAQLSLRGPAQIPQSLQHQLYAACMKPSASQAVLGEHSAAPCQGEQLSSGCQGCMQSTFLSSIQRVPSAPGLLTVQPEPSFLRSQAGQMELAAQGPLVPVTFMTDSFPPFLQILPSYHI